MLDIIIISLFILQKFILGLKLLDYGTLSVYVCIIQLREHLEPELDEVMPNYTKMNICINLCLVYIAKLYC